MHNQSHHHHNLIVLPVRVPQPHEAAGSSAAKQRHKPEYVSINWEGFAAQRDGVLFVNNPYGAGDIKRSLWSKGWQDGEGGMLKPESSYDCYWIVDDVLTNSSREGYQVYFGCPFTAFGVLQSEHLLRREALRAVPANEEVYRVRLARRHHKHSVRLLRSGQGA
jgi:hypothetical protein